ncbi:MAG: hypothetical protein J6P76_00085 [Acidaminococcaceae bacterium]|nr:hypothetical protein [Acidaminococcaceae bacterium]MBP5736682.1 hypothetical protein [Acidaminococcaceae bacterium]
MKKIAVLLLVCLVLTLHVSALAARRQAEEVPENPMDWSISTSPPASEVEKEAARWSLILENDLGIYAYDMNSLGYVAAHNGKVDTNTVGVTVKTLFTDKKMLKNLQEKYAGKLKGGEKARYCLLDMQYNMPERTYKVNEMRVFTDKNRIIETKINKTGFVPVPEKSFAEAMYEICLQFVTQMTAQAER